MGGEGRERKGRGGEGKGGEGKGGKGKGGEGRGWEQSVRCVPVQPEGAYYSLGLFLPLLLWLLECM